MTTVKNSLWCLKICPTEGCNRMCRFCGIHGIWKNKKDMTPKFMGLSLAEEVAKPFGKDYVKKRINIGQFGEPLIHPEIVELVSIFHKHNTTCLLTKFSNGRWWQSSSAHSANSGKPWIIPAIHMIV